MAPDLTPHNILRHELVGLPVNVTKSTDPTVQGVTGVVVDETKNMLIISTPLKRLQIAKRTSTFIFSLPDGTRVEVSGTRLHARPEDRLKTKTVKW